jgi:hypothetical protein
MANISNEWTRREWLQATAAGVAHYYVEQDHTPGDPLASLRQSYEYLRTLA